MRTTIVDLKGGSAYVAAQIPASRGIERLCMAEMSLVAAKIAPGVTELRELPLPEIPVDAALLKVEVAGV